jgi:hypothetical protein
MSIFHDKALKSVAEAAAKVMQQEELKGNQHKIDANKNGKVDAHDFKLLRGKKSMKKEEVEQLDELSKDTLKKYSKKTTDQHFSNLPTKLPTPQRKKGIERAADRLYLPHTVPGYKKEEVELDEAHGSFPTVADAKKRMDAGKTATGSVTKTKTGLVHKRDYKDDDNDSDDMQKKAKGYGARQNYKRSTRVNEAASFTEMLELYNEHGLKVLAPIETEEMDIDGTTIQVIDGDKINGYVETTVEEVTNDEFTKEFKDQQASFEGKKKQPKVATGKTTSVKEMPEEYELDESAGKITHYVAKKDLSNHKDYMDREGFDTHTRNLSKTHSLHKTHMGIMATDSPGEHGHHTEAGAQPASEYKKNVKALKKEEYELDERSLTSDEKSDMEKNVKGMKKGLSGFKERYGERAKSVMYGAATNMAKKD